MTLGKKYCSCVFLILSLIHTSAPEEVALVVEKTVHDTYEQWCITNSTEAITFVPRNNDNNSKLIFNNFVYV